MLSFLERQVTPNCEITSKCIQGLLEAYFKINKQIKINKNGGEQETVSIIRVSVG